MSISNAHPDDTMPLPVHIDPDDAALALLRDRANSRRAAAILELIRWQAEPLTDAEAALMDALITIGQPAQAAA